MGPLLERLQVVERQKRRNLQQDCKATNTVNSVLCSTLKTNQTVSSETEAPTDLGAQTTGISTTDCRTPEGVTVGLVDGIIAMSRVLRTMQVTPAVQEALKDLRQDEDVAWLVGGGPRNLGSG